jgi:hypothetical protein
MTGLAISVGAGLALTATTRAGRKVSLWHPAKSETLTPVTIRVHTAVPRNEHTELTRASDHVAFVSAQHNAPAGIGFESDTQGLTVRSAELAELRVMIEALDHRSTEMMSTVNQRIDDLQNHLPRFIDVKVSSRIREVEERLRTEFHDEQSRTLDAFLRTLDSKVLPRIAVVEEAVGAQGAEIGVIRERITKTDQTLDRVLDRLEKVADSIAPPLPGFMSSSHVREFSQKAVA